MNAALRRFWDEPTERERAALSAGAALIALAIAYAYVWLPVTRERDRLMTTVPQLREVAQIIERDAQELDRLKVATRPAVRDIKVALEQAATASGLRQALTEINSLGVDRARVVIPSMRRADWFSWVARLQSEHGVGLENVRAVALGGSDAVKVEAVFTTR